MLGVGMASLVMNLGICFSITALRAQFEILLSIWGGGVYIENFEI